MPEKKNNKEQQKEYRQKITENFLSLLQSDQPLKWTAEWQMRKSPFNMTSGRKYNGINWFNLSIIAMAKGYSDPRWLTFNGVRKYKDAHVKKGEHGTEVEYWMAMYIGEKEIMQNLGIKSRYMTFSEAAKLLREHKNDISDDDFRAITRYSTVFNAQQCEGLPPLEVEVNENITQDEFVTKAAKSMGVIIQHDGGDQCFYRPADDQIHLPEQKMFKSNYAYNSTTAHELAHASGAEKRLARNGITHKDGFSLDVYAYEELIAEITSAMVASNFGEASEEDRNEYITEHSKNHMAYVQSWIAAIKEKPDALINAIKEAELAADFMEMHGGILPMEEYNRKHTAYKVEENEDGQIVMKPKAPSLDQLANELNEFGYEFDPYGYSDEVSTKEEGADRIKADIKAGHFAKYQDYLTYAASEKPEKKAEYQKLQNDLDDYIKANPAAEQVSVQSTADVADDDFQPEINGYNIKDHYRLVKLENTVIRPINDLIFQSEDAAANWANDHNLALTPYKTFIEALPDDVYEVERYNRLIANLAEKGDPDSYADVIDAAQHNLMKSEFNEFLDFSKDTLAETGAWESFQDAAEKAGVNFETMNNTEGMML